MVIKYSAPAAPGDWIKYDLLALVEELTDAKGAVMALTAMPYQRAWAERLQEIELKREVAGTSKIEGADFTERELDVALDEGAPETDMTRSQRQARAAKQTYLWIADLPADRRVDEDLIRETHRRIVTGCDDDHCEPGRLRGDGHNVTFGQPRHRGVDGGAACAAAFADLCAAFAGPFRGHDPFIQALALHYHLGAMHPFQDGNGRTARALEALILQRAGLKGDLFISMSNYYYDEKQAYLGALSTARGSGHDLTSFLKFGLAGIASQCRRLLAEIKIEVEKALFRDVMRKMYQRLLSTRKRVLAKRQMAILELLLNEKRMSIGGVMERVELLYGELKAPGGAFVRDLSRLMRLRAIDYDPEGEGCISIRLDWATEITETDFFEAIEQLPTAKTGLVSTIRS